ncbi:putative WD40 repeat-like protein [Rosellinia necatrix]|uniref:Putative WD40 repeat-like protein n=1 Tax=Rosellinia necatrix TaxID=77044 RepID=A0A1W2TVZ7_ROSNE|nr:putative WD40 repeat-like protein [Rosellinia necatrix]
MPVLSPDRFVPFHLAELDRFRANKQPHELSPSERLRRTDEAGADAFCFTPKRCIPALSRRLSRSDCVERRQGTVLGLYPLDRQVSHGAVWSVGGTAPNGVAVDGGRGRLVSSGTNARLYTTSFSNRKPKSEEDQEKHEGRLALALNIDRVRRILDFDGFSTFPRCKAKIRSSLKSAKTIWTGTEWANDAHPIAKASKVQHVLPNAPFKVLDAPGLRDDFYCSIMDYSRSCNTLAVGLGNLLYGWSEATGVTLLNGGAKDGSWLTSVAFSSEQGGKSILAFGRSNGSLSLMSLFDSLLPRFEAQQPAPVACLCWRPTVAMRPSLNPSNAGAMVSTEDLLVGDEMGELYYYSVEWPEPWEVARENWPGSMTLMVRIKIHSQQICGLAWSPSGEDFATGGNDNLCCLFQADRVLETRDEETTTAARAEMIAPTSTSAAVGASSSSSSSAPPSRFPSRPPTITPIPTSRCPASPGGRGGAAVASRTGGDADYYTMPRNLVRYLPAGSEKHRWVHAAAVKAIAFCPWRAGLVATGGGSNDKCIHFYHTTSGSALATIAVAAQVTALIWSRTRREIAATFGYAQPDHPYRIAVFSWPDCRQVAAVPWDGGEHRALYAVAYPGGPSDTYRTRERRRSRTAEEGCVVVASSDESVKFHEVWLAGRKTTALGSGVLAGSDILEMEEGIDKEGDVIR